MSYRIYTIIILLLCFENIQAQVSSSDSVFLNGIFRESTYVSYWNKPGTWFTNHEVTSLADMYKQIDSNFIFHNEEFVDCYKNIEIKSDLILDTAINTTFNNFETANNVVLYGVKNPFVKVKFSLNNKIGYTYSVLDSTTQQSQQCTTAFILIPGTGVNMMTDVIKGLGYHNLNCYAENFLLQFGDVYTMSSPNEDHRAIIFNKKKLGNLAPAQPTYLQSYLNAANKSYGVNRLIETVAMIKYLKGKYSKVCVLGLSTGGKVALWSSLMSEPSATIVAAGYSILVDNDVNSQLVNTYSYANYLLDFDKDSTKKRISELKTQFLFTQASNDNSLAQLEVDSNLTQKYFQGLTNASFFYNYNYHSFPPCYVLDSFFNRSINMASCKIDYDKNTCRKDSVVLFLNFCGSPPYAFELLKDSVLISTHTSLSNHDSVVLYADGNYQISNIIDVNNVRGFSSDMIEIKKQPQVSALVSEVNYVCDSLKTKVQIAIAGKAPWMLYYSKNNLSDSMYLSKDTTYDYLQNANYFYSEIVDSNNCRYLLNDAMLLNYANLSCSIATPIYNCDSNKTLIHIDLQGNAPWVINYTFNGVPMQIYTTSFNLNQYLANGTYQFLNVSDAKGCSKLINQVFTFNYQPFSASITQQLYDCDSNKYRFDFSLAGNAPWTISYQDGIGNQYVKTTNNPTSSLYLANGNWTLNSVNDNTGCSQSFNVPIVVNYAALNATITSQYYDCDSNKLRINLSLQGNAPWTVQYVNTTTSITSNITTYNPSSAIYLPNGIFQFSTVSNQSPCSMSLNHIATNLYSPLSIQKISTTYDCDSNKVKINYSFTGDGPWSIHYKKLNGGANYVHNTSTPTSSIYLPTGDYEIQSVSDSKCTIPILDTMHINFPAITASLSPFVVSCDSGKITTSINILSGLKPYSLQYAYNNVPYIKYTNQNITPMYLNNGTYYFNSIKDSVGCELILNDSYQANYMPFEYTGVTTKYNCALDSTAIQWSFSGQPVLNLVYRQHNLPIDTLVIQNQKTYNVSNTTYNLLYVYDTFGCVDSINSPLVINNFPIQVAIDSIATNCDNKQYVVRLNAHGQAPWNVYYNLQNKQDTLVMSDSTTYWNVPSGDYYFINAEDATGCIYPLLQDVSLAPFIDFLPVLTTDYKQFFVTPSDLKQVWYKDGVLIDSVSKNKIDLIGEGTYYVKIIDKAGCEYPSNSIVIDFPTSISLYPNPAHQTTSILINEDFGSNWKYSIIDVWGNVVEKATSTKPLHTIDLNNFSNGVYSIVIEYANAKGKVKNVFRLLKN